MKINYEPLGKHIRLVDERNGDMVTDRLLGINIDKYFMPSVANVIGTDLSRYKLISKGVFACNPMHVGRDERLPVALYMEDEPAIVSPAYFMFEIIDRSVLLPEYLMMWFRRAEFDRICWLKTDGSVRGGLSWDDLGRMELPVPSLDRQQAVVKAYQTITDRIALKRAINDNLSGRELRHTQFRKSLKLANFPLYLFLCDKNALAILRKPLCNSRWRQGYGNGFKDTTRNLHKRSAGSMAFKHCPVLFEEVIDKCCSNAVFGNNRLKSLIGADLHFCDSNYADRCA
jgi:type I restriction enzyme S subunit